VPSFPRSFPRQWHRWPQASAASATNKRSSNDVTGLRLNAIADRSEIVPGESFTVRVDPRHRDGITADFRKPTLTLPPIGPSPTRKLRPMGGSLHYLGSVEYLAVRGWMASRPLRNSISGATLYLDALLPEPRH